ncbi:PAS domain-containing protein [Desulfoplanes sp.]
MRTLEETNNDITNLVNSTNIAAIFLDTRFNIKFYTPSSKKLFNLIATDIGRPLKHITKRFEDDEIMSDAEDVLDTLRLSSQFIRCDDGEWYNRKIFPYRTQDSKIEGIVITFEKSTELVRTKKQLKNREQRDAEIQARMHYGTWEYDHKQDELHLSEEAGRILGMPPSNRVVRRDAMLQAVHPDDRKNLERAYAEALENRDPCTMTYRVHPTGDRFNQVKEMCTTEFDDAGSPLVSFGIVQKM